MHLLRYSLFCCFLICVIYFFAKNKSHANEEQKPLDSTFSVIQKQTLQVNCLKDILKRDKGYPAQMSSDNVATINDEVNKVTNLIGNILASMDGVTLKKKNDIVYRKSYAKNCLLFCQILKKYYDSNDIHSTLATEKELKKTAVLTLTGVYKGIVLLRHGFK